MKIDLQSLRHAAAGDPCKSVMVNKTWVAEVVSHLEQHHQGYDTSALRIMCRDDAPDRIRVEKVWLNHIYKVLSSKNSYDAPQPSREMTPREAREFDMGMRHIETAFRYFDRVFSRMR